MGIAWLPEDQSEGFGKDNCRSAALPEQPPTKESMSRGSVAELKAQDLQSRREKIHPSPLLSS